MQAIHIIWRGAVPFDLTNEGDIVLNHRRRRQDVVLARHMTGKSIDLKVRDNGHDYEVFFNGLKVGGGYYEKIGGQNWPPLGHVR